MRTEDDIHRDLVAAFAMQGMLAHPTRYKPVHRTNVTVQPSWQEAMAQEAYELADAMIEERARRDSSKGYRRL